MITKRLFPSIKPYVDTESIVNYDLGENSFENQYSPLTKIKLHLVDLSNKFSLGEVSFKPRNKNDWDSIDSFYINSPSDWSYDEISKVWDKIIDSTAEYAEKEGIISTLNSVTIIIN